MPTQTSIPTSVYVHFPWCLRRCPYCDFATRRIEWADLPHRSYADAVVREVERRSAELRERRLVSVFFGGGTPSLWDAEELGRVLEKIRDAFPERDDEIEVTVECNPSSLDRAHLAALRSVGVNRVSLGVQSLDDERLRFLGRMHDARTALDMLEVARAEMPRVSADLMFGMPGQTPNDLVQELERITSLGVTHLSAYSLTIEPRTPFGELHRKRLLPVMSDDGYADLFVAAAEWLRGSGFEHYEVSNYASNDDRARHNEHYWRAGAYVGLGAAAVGCLETEVGKARRWRNASDPHEYMKNSDSASSEEFEEVLGPQELVRESLMLGLRTREGVSLDAIAERTGIDPLEGRERAVARRLELGDIERTSSSLRVPQERWLRLDGIVADLF